MARSSTIAPVAVLAPERVDVVHGADGKGLVPALAPTPTWLGPFFGLAGAWPGLARLLRPVACGVVPLVSPKVRHAIARNAPRIFGRTFEPGERRRFARQVIGSFYDFVLDVGRASRMSPEQLNGLVESVEGLDGYRAARSRKRGAILVTAHLGTFEAGLAALVREERKVRVVFKRDASGAFERLRRRLHASLGIIETPIDDGIDGWLALRDALLNDEVVVMQGDRAVPGQRSEVVAFLHGHVRLPTGPVRLAHLTGSPIVPVFALPTGTGTFRVLLKAAIDVETLDAEFLSRDPTAGPSRALRALADAIAEVVAANPHQWLALEAVFHEDAGGEPV
jgi:lauroyl/myristoyl acyltransferase